MSHSPADAFLQEASEILDELEQKLLELEANPDPGLVDNVFRSLHTLKGSGSMFGFDALASFTHGFETAFDLVRESRLAVDRELIDASLAARDHMTALLHADEETIRRLEASEAARTLSGRIEALIAKAGAQTGEKAGGAAAGEARAAASSAGGVRVYRIAFKPEPDALKNGMRPDLLMAELAELGETEVAIDASRTPPLEEMDPKACYCVWRVRLTTAALLEDVKNVFIFADDAELTIEVEPLGEAAETASEAPRPAAVSAAAAPAAEAEALEPERGRLQQQQQGKSESVRVQSHRLDEMMDQLGELVIVQTRLEQIAARLGDGALTAITEEVERLVTGLRDSTLSIRMLPIEIVFGKFRRVTRSLSAELGKEVSLITEGGETELDKKVIDSLSEPLVHMIRNAMDHGLEPAEERAAAGKPKRGTVRLSARQSGGEVLISVADDGRGLDAEAIRARAVERGLIAADAEMSVDQLHQLIFAPGFSTAKQLSSVSGRGVGMDAVRSAVEELRGTIDIATKPGAGTIVTLRLPVTLAIIDGLAVRVGGGAFVIPLSNVNECVELSSAEQTRDSGRTLLRIREELVPFLKLDELFGFPPSAEATRRVVIVGADGRRVGLVVDDILGQHQTVIKTLSVFHRDIEGFAGGTILGDGQVALIIDAPALVKTALERTAGGAGRFAA